MCEREGREERGERREERGERREERERERNMAQTNITITFKCVQLIFLNKKMLK